MPNIKSSILSVKTDAKRHAKNVAEKTRVKKASRKVIDAVAAGNTSVEYPGDPATAPPAVSDDDAAATAADAGRYSVDV